MPLTLYGYILRDLLKLGALATGVLVMVLSLGFAFAPMTEGLLGPWQLVKVVFYLMPATLPYALPFAAAFASTLVFFRLAADNEITACSASGLSYRSLCVPVLATGLCLTLVMFVLSNWVVPWFWQQVTDLVERDVTRLVIQQLRRRDTVQYTMGGRSKLVLRADAAAVLDVADRPGGPYRRIGLQGVAAGKIDVGTGRLEQDFTSEKAVVDIYRTGDAISAVVRLINPTGKDPHREILLDERNREFQIHDIELPFKQEPQFMSLTQLRDMAARPELNADVRIYRDQLLERLSVSRAVARIVDRLEAGELEMLGPREEIYRLAAPAHTAGENDVRLTASDDQPILMRIGRGMGVRQRLEAQRGRIKIDVDEITFEPRLLISFDDVKVIDQQLPTPAGRLATRDLEPLALRQAIMDDVDPNDSAALYHTVVEEAQTIPRLREELEYGGRAFAVRYVIQRLHHSIRARLHERAAMSVNCVLVMLLAAVMAMLLRRQVPLAIFFWCFLPIIMSMLMISSGGNFMKENPWELPAAATSVFVWLGNILLLLVVGLVYRRLNRN